MMDNPFLAFAIPSLLVVPAMGLLSRISADSPFATEVRRKALHVAVGLAALSFPLFLTTPAMVLTAVAAVLLMTLGFFAGAIYVFLALRKSQGNWGRFWMGAHWKKVVIL